MRAFSAPAVAIVYGDQFVDELFFFVAFDGRLVTRRVRFCGFDSVDIDGHAGGDHLRHDLGVADLQGPNRHRPARAVTSAATG